MFMAKPWKKKKADRLQISIEVAYILKLPAMRRWWRRRGRRRRRYQSIARTLYTTTMQCK